jgi:hypothetical protein
VSARLAVGAQKPVSLTMHPRSCDQADDVNVDLAKDTDRWSLFNTGDILLRFGEAAGLAVSDGGGSELHAVDYLCGAL